MEKTISVKEMQEYERDYMARKMNADLLMERAGAMCAHKIIKDFFTSPSTKAAAVFCGHGGNGGDGFVIARILAENNIPCFCYAVAGRDGNFKPLTQSKYKRAIAAGVFVEILQENCEINIPKNTVLAVDALFGLGSGSGYTPRPVFQTAVTALNRVKTIISIDGPSGIDMDNGEAFLNPPVKATQTYTLGFIKRGLVLEKAKKYTGKLIVLDIFA